MPTSEQESIFVKLSLTASAITLVCSLTVICTIIAGSTGKFICWKALKGVKVTKLSFHIIAMVSISDFIRIIGNLIGSPTSHSALCGFQSFLKTLGGVCSFFWISTMSFVVYALLFYPMKVRSHGIPIDAFVKRLHFIIWPFGIILAIIPLALNNFENSGGWCFISGDTEGQVLRLLCYYLWVVLTWLLVTYVYVRCVIHSIVYRFGTNIDSVSVDGCLNCC